MKTKLIMIWCLLCMLATSCAKDAVQATPELAVSTELISFSNQGDIKVFHVKSNLDWSASVSEKWVTLSSSNGSDGTSRIEVTVAANPEIEDRRATISITTGELTKQLEVVQSASVLFSVSEHRFELSNGEQELVFEIESNKAYSIESDNPWVQRKQDPTIEGSRYTETFVVSTNHGLFKRHAQLSIKQDTEELLVDIEQKESPRHVAAISEGVTSDAVALAAKLRVGWNLGNALEAAANSTSAGETMWGNPRTTKGLIDAVKAAGFNAVRIPCAWSGYIEEQATHRIGDSWLTRVKEVVDYCIDNQMYVIINMHWDGGWLEEHPLYSHQEDVLVKQKALWEQIAVYFRDYDEYLLFAGTNEVRANYETPTAEHNEVQQSYNQNFVNAVRSTGGRNTYRNLIVQSYNTNIQFAVDYFNMPADPTPNRLFAEVHAYDPWDFAGDENSNKYLWGHQFSGSQNVSTWGQEDWIDNNFAQMKTEFVDKGIPVILGEYGAILRLGLANATVLENHKTSRNAYLTYVTKTAKKYGMTPFYWDNGVLGNNGFGLFNRSTNQIVHQDAVDAIMTGAQQY